MQTAASLFMLKIIATLITIIYIFIYHTFNLRLFIYNNISYVKQD